MSETFKFLPLRIGHYVTLHILLLTISIEALAADPSQHFFKLSTETRQTIDVKSKLNFSDFSKRIRNSEWLEISQEDLIAQSVVESQLSSIKTISVRTKSIVSVSEILAPIVQRQGEFVDLKDPIVLKYPKALVNAGGEQLMQSARAVPYFKEGEVLGIRLFAINSESPLSALGLRNGDIITKIDGKPSKDPSYFSKSFFESIGSDRHLTFIRNHIEHEIQYKLIVDED